MKREMKWMAFVAVFVGLLAVLLYAEEPGMAELIVRHFFDAYNRHDPEAVAASFGADAKLWSAQSAVPLLEGRQRFREFFVDRFAKYPRARTDITSLFATGPNVVVHETAVLNDPHVPRQAVAVFRVGGGVIRNVWAIEPEDGKTGSQEPVNAVRLQEESYNRKDLAGFLSVYSKEAVLVEMFTGKILAEGEAALRERYRHRFDTSPNLHAEIVRRLSVGNLVVDHERVVYDPDDKKADAIVVYQIVDNRIRRVWFLF